MSFVTTPLTFEKLQQSEFEYHLRIYRDADKQQVLTLFENTMIWDSHSPARSILKFVAKSNVAKAFYLIFVAGVLVLPRYPTLGMIICAMAAGGSLLQIGLIFKIILERTKMSKDDDLGDIREHYKLVSDNDHDDESGTNLIPSGPRSFWVVEARHKISGRRELAGCVGLDFVQKDGKWDAELRRMVVSGRHTRQGLAARLVQAAVAHAKSHDLSSIYLSTSSAQEVAIHLYKRFGWIEEKRQDRTVFGATLQIVFMRLHLLGKNLAKGM